MESYQENNEIIKDNIAKFFQIGQKLTIKRTYLNDPEAYPSYVKDLYKEYMFIDFPTKEGLSVAIHPEKEIEIISINQDGIYTGTALVTEVVKDHIGGIWITFPDFLEKIQRKEFYRIEAKFPVKLMYIRNGSVVEEINLESFNISGGGISVISKDPIMKNEIIKLQFDFNGLKITSKVKFVHAWYESDRKRYVTGFMFTEIDKSTIDQIHKRVIQVQIEMRRKGLI